MKRIVLGIFMLAASAAVLAAQLYRWVDDKGNVEYRDTPPPSSAKKVEQPRIGGRQPPVKFYTHPDCVQPCAEARSLLAGRGVNFEEVTVQEEDAVEELQKVSGGTKVPVLLVGTVVTHGFSAPEYHLVLDTAGFPRSQQTAKP